LFPLHTTLFPGGMLPLQIFEPRYVDLVRDCMRETRGFGVTPIRQGREAGEPATPHLHGVLAEIVDWNQGRNGLLHILIKGTRRFRIVATETVAKQLLVADVIWLPPPVELATPEEFRQLRILFESFRENSVVTVNDESTKLTSNIEIVYRLTEALPCTVEEKLEVLSSGDDRAMARALARILARLVEDRSG
jgi:Lon protease-like protein